MFPGWWFAWLLRYTVHLLVVLWWGCYGLLMFELNVWFGCYILSYWFVLVSWCLAVWWVVCLLVVVFLNVCLLALWLFVWLGWVIVLYDFGVVFIFRFCFDGLLNLLLLYLVFSVCVWWCLVVVWVIDVFLL